MALLFRPCISKNSINGIFNRLCKVPKHNVQIAHISGKINRIDVFRHPPYPYKKKSITLTSGMFDYGTKRIDENSRLIVVEGPIAAGKDKFARELAKQLDMAYMPPPSFDMFYKDAYGFDLRSLDHLLPETAQSCDIEKFLCNPHHKNAAACQVIHLVLKANAYAESILHILSTGEGVVMNRCLYSDMVFMGAMFNAGYVSQRCLNYYRDVLQEITLNFLRPHLVIYLDVPVNVVQENIRKRCIPYEVNSKVLTKEYLTDIENIYKNDYLPFIEDHAYVLMYDWTCGGEVEDVVEDIERINLEYDHLAPEKIKDWTFTTNDILNQFRMYFDREKRHIILTKPMLPEYMDLSEMYLTGPDLDKYEEVIAKHTNQYEDGFNPKHGDKVLWKWKDEEPSVAIPNVVTNQELVAAS